MNESRLDNVKKDIIVSGVSNLLLTLLPFVIRTYFVHYLGSEYLGLNSLCTSIIYVLNAADFGISNAFVYRLYKPVAQKNTKEVCRLLKFYRRVYHLIGGTIFLIGLIIMPFLRDLITGEVPEQINLYLVFLIYLINTSISYVVFMHKELILIAHQRKDYVDLIICFSLAMMYGFQLFFVIRKNYYGYLIAMPIFTLLSNIIKGIVADKKYPYYKCEGMISKEYAKYLFKDVFSVAVYRLRDMSRNAFDSIIISAFVGLVALANYQNYYTVLMVPILLRNILVNAIIPSMGNCVAVEDKQTIYEVYKIFVFFYSYISGWFAICYGNLIQDFISIWLGEQFILSEGTVLLLVTYFYLLGFCDQTKVLRETAGLWKRGRVFAGLEMLFNLILNIAFGYFGGVNGIILATIFTIVLINIPFENRLIYNDFFKGGIKRVILIYIKAFMWFVFSGIITGFLCNFIRGRVDRTGILILIISTIVPLELFVAQNYKTEEMKYILERINIKRR